MGAGSRVGNGGRKSSLILVLGLNNGFPIPDRKRLQSSERSRIDRRRARSEYARLTDLSRFSADFLVL